MKLSLVILVALSCLAISISASPIQIVEKSKEAAVPNQARQAEQPAAPVEDDDDDDDGNTIQNQTKRHSFA